MKHLTFVLLLFSLFAKAQNGGQFFENNVAKVQYISNDATTVKLLVISKQNCTADYKVDFGPVQSVSIAAFDTMTFIVPITTATFKAKAESQTTCTNQPDMGWVEIIISTVVVTPQVLPVKLISFTGTQKDNAVSLKWEAANETVGKFEVEKSINGRTFNILTTIDKSANNFYTTTDQITGVTYYRLRMIDKNNLVGYSKVITFRGKNSYGFKLYGNPVIGSSLTFSINSKKAESVKASVFDLQGRLIFSKTVSIVSGENIIDLPIQAAKGIYHLVVKTELETFSKKFIL